MNEYHFSPLLPCAVATASSVLNMQHVLLTAHAITYVIPTNSTRNVTQTQGHQSVIKCSTFSI